MGIPRKFTTMLRPILFFLVVLFSMYLADIEVDVSDDFDSMDEQDRTIVCGITGQLDVRPPATGRTARQSVLRPAASSYGGRSISPAQLWPPPPVFPKPRPQPLSLWASQHSSF